MTDPNYDGCSGGQSAFFRLLYRRGPPWEGCCNDHDDLYAPGGAASQRKSADQGLYDCVRMSGYPLHALVMWALVRFGGHPIFPFHWRWGFSRDYADSWWYDHVNIS